MKNYFLQLFNSMKKWIPQMFGGFFKWIILSLITGTAVGFISSAFHIGLEKCADIRKEQPYIILLLPVAGLLIVSIYKLLKLTHDKGTNMVLIAVRDGSGMTWKNTLSIFTGGSVGSQLGIWFKLNEQDHRLITMCGMSAGFSALFGTPAAAAFFSMEVISVGIMHYSAIIPCSAAALIGFKISSYFGVSPSVMNVKIDSLNSFIYSNSMRTSQYCFLLRSEKLRKNLQIFYKKPISAYFYRRTFSSSSDIYMRHL